MPWWIFYIGHTLFLALLNYLNASHLFELLENPLGSSNKKGSHEYFLLIVAMALLLWHQIVLLWHQVTLVASKQHLYQTIVLPPKLATWSIHDYLFCYCPLVGILFEVWRIVWHSTGYGKLRVHVQYTQRHYSVMATRYILN